MSFNAFPIPDDIKDFKDGDGRALTMENLGKLNFFNNYRQKFEATSDCTLSYESFSFSIGNICLFELEITKTGGINQNGRAQVARFLGGTPDQNHVFAAVIYDNDESAVIPALAYISHYTNLLTVIPASVCVGNMKIVIFGFVDEAGAPAAFSIQNLTDEEIATLETEELEALKTEELKDLKAEKGGK